MLFGLLMENFEALRGFKIIEKLRPQYLESEVHKFKELIIEAAFLVRSLFFLLFGYLMKLEEIINTETIIYAIGIVSLIYIFRAIQLKFFKIKLKPLLFIAPRGLITILLFLNIPQVQKLSIVNNSLIIQVIVLTALVMMLGLIFNDEKKVEEEIKTISDQNEALFFSNIFYFMYLYFIWTI